MSTCSFEEHFFQKKCAYQSRNPSTTRCLWFLDSSGLERRKVIFFFEYLGLKIIVVEQFLGMPLHFSVYLIIPYGVPQHSLKFLNILWSSSTFFSVLQHSLEFLIILQCSSIFFSVPQHSLEFLNILWSSSTFFSVPWYSLEFLNILWCSLVFLQPSSLFLGILRDPRNSL